MTMIGSLGKDAELRILDSGSQVISFSIAHTEKWKNAQQEQQERTTWVNCSIWRSKDASVKIVDYLKKGQKVYVEGMPSARAWKKDDGEAMGSLELNVANVELLGKNESSSGSQTASTGTSTPGPSSSKSGDDEDFPF